MIALLVVVAACGSQDLSERVDSGPSNLPDTRTTVRPQIDSSPDDTALDAATESEARPTPTQQPAPTADEMLAVYRDGRPQQVVATFHRASSDAVAYQQALAILLFEEPPAHWSHGFFTPSDTLTELRLDRPELDDRTGDIVHAAVIAHIVNHVVSGEQGEDGWYVPAQSIDATASFVAEGDSYVGSLVVGNESNSTVHNVSARLVNGRWVIDGLDWTAGNPGEPSLIFDREWTDTTVVHGDRDDHADVVTIRGTDSTDTTVIEARRDLPVATLSVPPGTTVSVLIGTRSDEWPRYERRMVGASGELVLGVPPAGLLLRVTYVDGSATVVTVVAP